MKYFLILYIVITFALGVWQTYRYNYKLQIEQEFTSKAKDFTDVKKNAFSKVLLKEVSLNKIVRFYSDNANYKLITTIDRDDEKLIMDLGTCTIDNVEQVTNTLLGEKSIYLEGVIVPLNRHNSIKKFFFSNDYKNNLWFYYDLPTLSDGKVIRPYIIHVTNKISNSIVPNNVKPFNPHLMYLMFWYALSLFGAVSFYVRNKS